MPLASLDDYWGAGYPYGASGYPDNLPNMAYGPPGGGLIGMPGATSGAPSMGYPALGRLPPAAAPGPAQGLSLSSNPITRLLAAINPIGSAQADVLHPNLTHPSLYPLGGGNSAPSPSQPLPPGAANSLPVAFGNPTLQDYNEWLTRQLASSPPASPTTASPAPGYRYSTGATGGVDAGMLDAYNYASKVGNYPMWPTPPVPTTSVATSPRGVKRTDAAYGPYDAPPAAGTGAPKGSPSQTPRPPSSADRFVRIDRVNAGPLAQPGRGYQTALNLAGLFGRG